MVHLPVLELEGWGEIRLGGGLEKSYPGLRVSLGLLSPVLEG